MLRIVPFTLFLERLLLEERKIGLIPRVIVPGGLGPKEYAVLVTDKRSIFVLEKKASAAVALALGSVVAQAAADRRTFDYEQADPEALASDPKNMTIPHESLERLRVKKALLGPIRRFTMEYRTVEGKGKKVKAQLVPPGGHVKAKKQQGLSKGEVFHEYAKKVQDVYQRALPATASAQVGDWQL